MMLKRTVMTLVCIFLFPLQSIAALQCDAGLHHVKISGNVTTINVSSTKQVGQICVTMIRSSNGREVFNDCGALIGNVVSADLQAGSTILKHTALFDMRDMLVTRNDYAQITGIQNVDETGTPCSFNMVESINDIEKGAGIFRDSKMNVTASGTISFCPGNNLNLLTLQGEACVRK